MVIVSFWVPHNWRLMRTRVLATLALAAVVSLQPVAASSTGERGPQGPAAWKRDMKRAMAGLPSSAELRLDGEILFRRDAKEGRPPASVEKLILTMALFDHFGPDERIETHLCCQRSVGRSGERKPVGTRARGSEHRGFGAIGSLRFPDTRRNVREGDSPGGNHSDPGLDRRGQDLLQARLGRTRMARQLPGD